GSLRVSLLETPDQGCSWARRAVGRSPQRPPKWPRPTGSFLLRIILLLACRRHRQKTKRIPALYGLTFHQDSVRPISCCPRPIGSCLRFRVLERSSPI